MALDSREKRANASRVGRPYLRSRYTALLSTEAGRIAASNAYGGNALTPGTFQAAWAASANVVIQPGTVQ